MDSFEKYSDVKRFICSSNVSSRLFFVFEDMVMLKKLFLILILNPIFPVMERSFESNSDLISAFPDIPNESIYKEISFKKLEQLSNVFSAKKYDNYNIDHNNNDSRKHDEIVQNSILLS